MTSRRRTSKGGCGGVLFAAVWIAGWSAGTLAFDAMLVRGIHGQWRATSFPTVVGAVTHSEVDVERNDDGTRYSVDVRYRYFVDRRHYEGDTYRYGMTSSGENETREIVESLTVGREVDVYYDPQDPADSLLRPGVEGADLFLALFLAPFNVVMLGAWTVAVRKFFPAVAHRPAGGAKIVRRGFRQYVCTSAFRPGVVAAIVLLGTSFVSIFVMAFGFSPNPPMPVILAVWGGVISATLFSYVWCRVRIGTGRTYLVLDEVGRTVTLPRGEMGGRGPLVVPFSDVEKLHVRETATAANETSATDSDGDTCQQYEILLTYRDRDGQRQERIAEKSDRTEAEELAAWIEEQITKGPRR